jgi:hypothetical protein
MRQSSIERHTGYVYLFRENQVARNVKNTRLAADNESGDAVN